MAITLDADGCASVTLNASNAQVLLNADGERAHPAWLLITWAKDTTSTVYVETGGVLTEGGATGSAGTRQEDYIPGSTAQRWAYIRGGEVAISGSAATAVVIRAIA